MTQMELFSFAHCVRLVKNALLILSPWLNTTAELVLLFWSVDDTVLQHSLLIGSRITSVIPIIQHSDGKAKLQSTGSAAFCVKKIKPEILSYS